MDILKDFLYQDGSITSENAINTRLRRAKEIEKLIGLKLEDMVVTDNMTYISLLAARSFDDLKHNYYQNVIRKYYFYKYGKQFPTLTEYKNSRK